MQFVVTALDYTEPETLNRRLQLREAHVERLKLLMAQGRLYSGGALLDDQGKMIGSSLHLDFPDRDSLEKHLQQDPYVTGKVWEKVEIRPVKLLAIT